MGPPADGRAVNEIMGRAAGHKLRYYHPWRSSTTVARGDCIYYDRRVNPSYDYINNAAPRPGRAVKVPGLGIYEVAVEKIAGPRFCERSKTVLRVR